jgi:hypothetical protein
VVSQKQRSRETKRIRRTGSRNNIVALRGYFNGLFGVNADEFAFLAFVFEFYEAFDQCKKRIVFADADVIARLPFRAALTREYIAAENVFAAEFLESEPLCIRIAAVSG